MHFRRILWVMATATLFSGELAARDSFSFGQYQINAPFNISQDPIRANLTDNPGKELLLVGEKDGESRLAMFVFNDTIENYVMQFDIALDKAYFAYDVSDEQTSAEKMQSLYFLASNKVSRFVLAKEPQFVDVAKVSSIYINHDAKYLKQSDFVKDINDDGLDDVVLMDFTNLNIYLQQADQQFVSQQLTITPTVEIFESSVSYTEKPYYLVDMNFDGRKDVVLPGEGVLDVYSQNQQGSFADSATPITLHPSITAINWWDARGADGKNLDQSDFAHRTIDDLRDIDNDGVADLIVRYTQSAGVLDKSNDYEVYLGRQKDQQVIYQQKADTAIKSDGTLAQLDFIDVDNDERQEVMASSFDISVSQVVSALLTGSVDQQVLIFALDKNLKYQQQFEDEVELKFSLSSGKSGSPVIELADLDGDGAKELILSEEDHQLKIFAGSKQGKLLTDSYQTVKIHLPKNGVLLSSDDINMDGRSELLVRYSSEDNDDGENRQNRLLVLHLK
ncbi:VCBS repeat-containing protein [Thalassotalea sp. HSM 43]|uniref:FG-GAP repeat domain-containing protein n=1 Tax=Thalassotalea sp. HSM 43 TaxID=2552945 RepID=UPI00108070CB|nr:VCBS repeat-containing protein [Thalassotalea sp. HSM 43]QBY05357.1 VCBS repeat-containing protein [Thalassotalea sp. HSM 43]